jgi:hypothetical protein
MECMSFKAKEKEGGEGGEAFRRISDPFAIVSL